MEYEIINNTKFEYLYLIEDKQLYTAKSSSKNATIYRCKNRDCNNRLRVKNNICERKVHVTHHENDGGEKEYTELKTEIMLMKKIEENLDNKKSIVVILAENNVPFSVDLQHKLYRYRNKLLKNNEPQIENNENIDNTTTKREISQQKVKNQGDSNILQNVFNVSNDSEQNTNFSDSTNYQLNFDIEQIPRNSNLNATNNILQNVLSVSNKNNGQNTNLPYNSNNQLNSIIESESDLNTTNNILQNAFSVLNENPFNEQEDEHDQHNIDINASTEPNNQTNNIIILHNEFSNEQSFQSHTYANELNIETIFIRQHDNMNDENTAINTTIENTNLTSNELPSEKPQNTSEIEKFSIREIAIINHCVELNKSCINCNEKEAKLVVFPCCDQFCIKCWKKHNNDYGKHILNIKSKRLIIKALENRPCMNPNCKESVKKFYQFKN